MTNAGANDTMRSGYDDDDDDDDGFPGFCACERGRVLLEGAVFPL